MKILFGYHILIYIDAQCIFICLLRIQIAGLTLSEEDKMSLRRRKHINGSTNGIGDGAGCSYYPSGATLIIVPDTLIDHWRNQIDTHVASGVRCRVYADSTSHSELPSADVLSTFHIVLITHRYVLIYTSAFTSIFLFLMFISEKEAGY